MTIDIIIPTYRPGEKFLRLLRMLKKQTVPYRRLIIINTEHDLMPESTREEIRKMGAAADSVASEDAVGAENAAAGRDAKAAESAAANGNIKAAESVAAAQSVILRDITKAEFDHAATRRMAVSMSDADIFICMTDDAVPADEYLIENLLAKLELHPDAAIVCARQLADKSASEAEKFIRNFNYPDVSRIKSIADIDELGIKTFFSSNVCCAYRRSAYDAVGGFIDTAIFNEDMIYAATALKNGWKSIYCAEAVVYHSHDYTGLQQFHRNFDLGVSQAMHPEVFAGISSESEGVKLVKQTVAHLAKNGAYFSIPVFIWRTGWRYLGFRLGRAYKKLPKSAVRAFAMNKRYVGKLK